MIAAEVLQRQLAACIQAHQEYKAGMKLLEDEYLLLKQLADAEAEKGQRLKDQLKQLSAGRDVLLSAPPMHPLAAAVAGQQQAPHYDPRTAMKGIGTGQVVAQAPRGLTQEDLETLPQMADYQAPQGPMHSRQDPWGTQARTTDQNGAFDQSGASLNAGDPLPRGTVSDPTPPLITRDLEGGV